MEFLDKELEALFPESRRKGRRADKLVKVRLVDGEDAFVLIHGEVQGYVDVQFARRMFIYGVRIRERYGLRFFALAILTDSDPNWHPTDYREEFEGTETVYRFNTYKVLDHPPESLEHPENPFSIAIETAWHFAKTRRRNDQAKLSAGLILARRLFERGYEKDDIRDFLSFIHLHFRFSEPENQRMFDAEIDELVKTEPTMTIKEIYEDVMKERFLEEGRKEGREEGHDLSIRKMLLKGMQANMVSNILDVSIERVVAIETALRKSGELTA